MGPQTNNKTNTNSGYAPNKANPPSPHLTQTPCHTQTLTVPPIQTATHTPTPILSPFPAPCLSAHHNASIPWTMNPYLPHPDDKDGVSSPMSGWKTRLHSPIRSRSYHTHKLLTRTIALRHHECDTVMRHRILHLQRDPQA